MILIKWLARVAWRNCKPTTAAGARWFLCSTNTACVAVTSGRPCLSASNGTEKTKLSGSMVCWWTARWYHTSSTARLLPALKCLQQILFKISSRQLSRNTYGPDVSGGLLPWSCHLSNPLRVAINDVWTPNIWYPCLHVMKKNCVKKVCK